MGINVDGDILSTGTGITARNVVSSGVAITVSSISGLIGGIDVEGNIVSDEGTGIYVGGNINGYSGGINTRGNVSSTTGMGVEIGSSITSEGNGIDVGGDISSSTGVGI